MPHSLRRAIKRPSNAKQGVFDSGERRGIMGKLFMVFSKVWQESHSMRQSEWLTDFG